MMRHTAYGLLAIAGTVLAIVGIALGILVHAVIH